MAHEPAEDDDMGESWIRIRPLKSPNGIPASIRMRQWLKSGLRAYQLKVEQLTGNPPEPNGCSLPARPEETADDCE